jgi:hydantoinase/carbamoylase family amidase
VAVALPAVDSARVIRDLRELQARTDDERGAQRLCWTDGWLDARAFLEELLDELNLGTERDEAGNLWARLEGADPGAPALALGSHLDSVPDGGWLDGTLGVMAAVGVLRAHAAADERPPRPLVLVDWADEEGARFGHSLFGSSAFCEALEPADLEGLSDSDGRPIAAVLREHGVDLEAVGASSRRREELGQYLELHIEQGPRMEAEGIRVAAVAGCVGIERLRFEFSGQASHAGTTPMEMRRDAALAAAEAALAIERVPIAHGGVATTGELRLAPGIATAVAGRAALSVDLRHPNPLDLAGMLAGARAAANGVAANRGCDLAETPIWRIEPTVFDAELVGMARAACEDVGCPPAELTSGALHDAAILARILPAAMLFTPSRDGVSHAREEDTDESDLALAIEAFGALAARALAA